MTVIFKLTLPLNDVRELDCEPGCGGNVDAETHHFRHSEGYAVPRGIPRSGAEHPSVDAGGSPSPPSSSRSGDPPVRGRTVRCRYRGGTIWGIPALSARMTCIMVTAYRGAEITWTCRAKFSVIQRPQAVESPEEGHTPNSGCGRVFSSTVILAKRGSHTQGQSSTPSLPSATIRGIPARSARMTADFQHRCRYPQQPTGGFFGRFAPSE